MLFLCHHHIPSDFSNLSRPDFFASAPKRRAAVVADCFGFFANAENIRWGAVRTIRTNLKFSLHSAPSQQAAAATRREQWHASA